jgi:hypothetical protein
MGEHNAGSSRHSVAVARRRSRRRGRYATASLSPQKSWSTAGKSFEDGRGTVLTCFRQSTVAAHLHTSQSPTYLNNSYHFILISPPPYSNPSSIPSPFTSLPSFSLFLNIIFFTPHNYLSL